MKAVETWVMFWGGSLFWYVHMYLARYHARRQNKADVFAAASSFPEVRTPSGQTQRHQDPEDQDLHSDLMASPGIYPTRSGGRYRLTSLLTTLG